MRGLREDERKASTSGHAKYKAQGPRRENTARETFLSYTSSIPPPPPSLLPSLLTPHVFPATSKGASTTRPSGPAGNVVGTLAPNHNMIRKSRELGYGGGGEG